MAKRGSGNGGAGNSRAGRKAGRLLDIPEREVQRGGKAVKYSVRGDE